MTINRHLPRVVLRNGVVAYPATDEVKALVRFSEILMARESTRSASLALLLGEVLDALDGWPVGPAVHDRIVCSFADAQALAPGQTWQQLPGKGHGTVYVEGAHPGARFVLVRKARGVCEMPLSFFLSTYERIR